MSDATAPNAPQPGGPQAGMPHPYHLVEPSPWPLLGSIAAGVMAAGAVVYFHGGTYLWLVLGALGVLAVMFGWWRDVVLEAVVQKAHTAVVTLGLRYGMLLFIASEVMFFVAFFWAYFDASLFPTAAIEFTWPPPSIETIPWFPLPLLMTMVLLLSGGTVTEAHHALQEGDNRRAARWLGITVLLGAAFTGIQLYEYAHAGFAFTDGIYPSTFYMATGFHGFHVLIGTIFLAVCWVRTVKGHFTADSHFGFEAAAWYWHFVDVVWLFLFTCVYWWWGSAAAAH
ncbi:MAG: cytochrome c oxidase subunit 3 [Inquilinus sp.]|nr:cytochrome c oxidase subunit 3 [Inquilinus sp.]